MVHVTYMCENSEIHILATRFFDIFLLAILIILNLISLLRSTFKYLNFWRIKSIVDIKGC